MKNLSLEKRIFNYRLSRMRRISENGFRILANRWRIFRRSIALEPEKVKTITLAAITLHNWQRSISSIGKVDLPNGLVDQENSSNEIISGNWRDEEPTGTWFPITNDKFGNRPTNISKTIREEFTKYFNTEGAVSWQWRAAKIDI